MVTFNIEKLCSVLSPIKKMVKTSEVEFNGLNVVWDTRKMTAGDIFFAIKGERFDGHKFIDTALEKKASIIVVEKGYIVDHLSGVNIIWVENVTLALRKVASFWFSLFSVDKIAITGSNGKTTTKEMINYLVKNNFDSIVTEENLNNQFGVSQTLLKTNENHEKAIVEVGTNARGEIQVLGDMVKPNIVIFTNIGNSHLEGLSDINEVYKEKISLINSVSSDAVIFVNMDNKFLADFYNSNQGKYRIVGVGINSGDYQAKEVEYNEWNFPSYKLNGHKVSLNISGRYQIYNSLLALAIADYLGIKLQQATKKISSFCPPSLRGEWRNLGKAKVFVDCYNANPSSMELSVKSFSRVETEKKKVLVLGDMTELGEKSNLFHERIGALVASLSIDEIYFYGDFSKHYKRGFVKESKNKNSFPKVKQTKDKQELKNEIQNILNEDGVLFLKGSRTSELEKLLPN